MTRPVPPLDGSVRVWPGFADFHYAANPRGTCAQFFREDTGGIVRVTFEEFARASHRVAHALRADKCLKSGDVVALIALCDTLMYMALMVGMTRAGLIPFPISPRNSPVGIHSMLSKTGCRHLITTQSFLQPLIDACKVEFTTQCYEVTINEIPSFTEVFPLLGKETSSDPFEPFVLGDWNPDWDDPILYLHSSGSTGSPRAIAQTHRTALLWCSLPCVAEGRSYSRNIIWGSMMAPTFHALGVYTHLYSTFVTGFANALFSPQYPAPPIMPTPQNTLEAIKKSGANTAIVVPAFLEACAWVHSREAVDFLAQLEICAFGGGPLSSKVGNTLVEHGVKLNTLYGATEFGTLSSFFDVIPDSVIPGVIPKSPMDWSWVRFSDRLKLRWADQGNGTYELQIMTHDLHRPSVQNLPDLSGYATVGRLDDVLVLASGEKTVPLPMEGHILHNPLVQGALIFGTAREQVGVLVEPKPGYTLDPKDDKAVVEFRNRIWPTVEEANKDAPAFSRIFKEMILVTNPTKPMTRAAKGTVQRNKTLSLYASEINSLYDVVNSSMYGERTDLPSSWTPPVLLAWLQNQAQDIHSTDVKLGPTDDLFHRGFDSLSATFLRNRILGALRSSNHPNARRALAGVTQNMIYAYPTLEQLSQAVAALLMQQAPDDAAVMSPAESIEALVQRYSRNFPKPSILASLAVEGTVVLLTGSTGSLGSYILAELLGDERVRVVYALNRPSKDQSAPVRQKAAFRDKGLPLALLMSEKLVFIDGDASKPNLDIEADIYSKIHSSVTHIIHNAWKVDFNLALSSFETNIRATRGLIDFALTSKYGAQVKLVFVSSITVAQSWDYSNGSFPEDVLQDASYAVGGGYGEGKYVAERVPASETGLKCTTVRIGQICGGVPDGAWASTDWFPILVKSSITLQCLPDSSEDVSWIPMPAATQVMLDVSLAEEIQPIAINAVHPRPAKWRNIMKAISKALGESCGVLPLVPFKEWVQKLERCAGHNTTADDLNRIPALRILPFFQQVASRRAVIGEQGDVAEFTTDKCRAISASLDQLQVLDDGDAEMWVRYWRSKAFI
ncbi:acetyl-CoA synthetase-like protein [Heliocybe sulcata]|uniref:Acetyl-CoA synthetase-like protein n=1 Tax=Heliocybe sulcata TaxID=5364 RepID=A0A5C3MQU3_9AGAM|nr:acetyl-CoA synthetase-like protein [Heliocybe sulcata]